MSWETSQQRQHLQQTSSTSRGGGVRALSHRTSDSCTNGTLLQNHSDLSPAWLRSAGSVSIPGPRARKKTAYINIIYLPVPGSKSFLFSQIRNLMTTFQ